MKILSVKDVHYKRENTNILNGATFNVDKGDCISIIGPSGSGKSTLLKICADLLPINRGELYFKGENYLNYNPLEIRKQISYCVQLPYLFGTSVYDNLEFPFKVRKEPFDRYRVIELLKKFNLEEEFLQKDIVNLSGGEKQRVSIIRNLIYIPEIVLLDEATSALDKENSKCVENYIKELNIQGLTVLWVTHSLEQSTSIFNKRILVSEGKIDRMEVIK
ncbi:MULTISPECIES: ATP-binding cassette domain-containing protein [Clostridium]|uniref:ATP-binding cassette domain-containing protein n=1 Tax=Clostridium senegalense TaxID=1465809 RepID=A0A6M0H297_9CLOT|nr:MULTISPECIES: ATP-binding cassette domain-containing protein [Clostridium]NEU04729.1 ATP-binding cassette domain-containing protein [Clostridium senegalense]